MGAFLPGARIAVACATLLLVCLLAQQVLGIELGGVVGTGILVLPLLALAFVLWESVSWLSPESRSSRPAVAGRAARPLPLTRAPSSPTAPTNPRVGALGADLRLVPLWLTRVSQRRVVLAA